MPQFRYRALNSQGHELEGTLSATDANAAVTQLSRQGLRLKSIEESVARTPQPSIGHFPQTAPSMPASVSAPRQAPAAPRWGLRSSPRSTYSERQFFFVQLAGLLRTGISPTDSLNTILSRSSGGRFREQFVEMAKMTAEGGSLSDAMAAYPNMFTKGQVGATRAGEQGGYLPDALQTVGEQQKQTRAVFWFFFGVLLLLPVLFILILATISVSAGVNTAIDAVRDGNENSDALKVMLDSLKGPMSAIFFSSLGAALLLYFIGKHYSFRPLRHRLGLAVPPLRWRAYNENLAHFSFHLGRLAKSGISPFSSWRLAADAVPNERYADRLRKVASELNEKTKLSDLLYRSTFFPRETAPAVGP